MPDIEYGHRDLISASLEMRRLFPASRLQRLCRRRARLLVVTRAALAPDEMELVALGFGPEIRVRAAVPGSVPSASGRTGPSRTAGY